MLRQLLKKSGRVYDECVNKNGTISIQIHFNDSRWQWEFDAEGNMLEEWINPHVSLWINE